MKFKVEEEIRHIVYWHNGQKWLVKETFTSKKDAEDHAKEMEKRNAQS